MPGDRTYFVYIMSSYHRTIYIGVTGDLVTRVLQHKESKIDGFTKTYKCHSLVYFEEYEYPDEAIMREKQLKKWRRSKKIWLIERMNPEWNDLSKSILEDLSASSR